MLVILHEDSQEEMEVRAKLSLWLSVCFLTYFLVSAKMSSNGVPLAELLSDLSSVGTPSPFHPGAPPLFSLGSFLESNYWPK